MPCGRDALDGMPESVCCRAIVTDLPARSRASFDRVLLIATCETGLALAWLAKSKGSAHRGLALGLAPHPERNPPQLSSLFRENELEIGYAERWFALVDRHSDTDHSDPVFPRLLELRRDSTTLLR